MGFVMLFAAAALVFGYVFGILKAYDDRLFFAVFSLAMLGYGLLLVYGLSTGAAGVDTSIHLDVAVGTVLGTVLGFGSGIAFYNQAFR